MTVLPLVVSTSLPSIVSLTGSIRLISHRAALLRDVLLKLCAIFLYKGRRGHRRRVAKGADRIAHDVAADVKNEIEIACFALAVFNAMTNFFHPVTALATRATLAARLVREKARQIPRGADHTSAIVHDNHAARAEQAAGCLDRLVIEIHFLDLLGTQHRHRSTAGNDALEFSAVGHAAAVFLEKFHKRITHLDFVDAGLADVAAHAEKFSAFAFFRPARPVSRRSMFEIPRQRP